MFRTSSVCHYKWPRTLTATYRTGPKFLGKKLLGFNAGVIFAVVKRVTTPIRKIKHRLHINLEQKYVPIFWDRVAWCWSTSVVGERVIRWLWVGCTSFWWMITSECDVFFFFSPQAPKKVGGRPFELPEASAVRRPPTTISKCPAGRVPGDNPSYLLSSPFYSLSPSRNSDPGSHSRLFSPPTHYGPCLAFLSRQDISSFFPRRLESNCAYPR